MRKFLAILVCKLGRAVGKLVGKGSSMPGKFALKICPDILARVQLPSHIIAVTGSNGKTSTVEMIAAILRAGGKTVVYNEEGSNQIEGVTTLVLTHASLTGRVRADVLLIESDERYAAQSFRYFHPTEFVITNLYRDQLTRNGHPEWVYDAILPALHPETELILNADDPLSSCFARGHEKVRLQLHGAKALGLCGIDGQMIMAEKLDSDVDLGYVGQIQKITTKPILDALNNGYVPIISTVATSADGQSYNINADTAAARIASCLRAENLILMTDIAGLLKDKDDPSTLIPTVNVSDVPYLKKTGIISGGMIPKIECCVEAVRRGVKKTSIIDGRIPHSILIELLSNEGAGTQFI